MLSSAIKALWDFSGPDLSRLCLTYQSRRNADKQQLFESPFADLVSAFEVLNADDVIPDIYCEAIDLLSLPSLELDSISKRLETNTKVLQSVCTSVESLSPKLVKPIQDQASSLSSPTEHAVAVSWPDKMNTHVSSIDRRNIVGLEKNAY